MCAAAHHHSILLLFFLNLHLYFFLCLHTSCLLRLHRTFRKDPQTLHGYVTLAILEKLFRKHGNALSDTCIEQIRDLYAVGLDEAAPILKVRLGGCHFCYPIIRLRFSPILLRLPSRRNWSTSALSTCTKGWTRRCVPRPGTATPR
jgi:hypothetical protein